MPCGISKSKKDNNLELEEIFPCCIEDRMLIVKIHAFL